ncbi:MAG: aspartate kinase [Flavobacteriales bacterium]|nr:aspartate kinase [Flavobacteriales bacterium]
MLVFKFGGASVKDAEAVKNVANVLRRFNGESILVVISAMGKTTNLLETLVHQYFNKQNTNDTMTELKRYHREIIADLMGEKADKFYEVENLFIELECALETEVSTNGYDFVYDQIVPYGELISTRIVSHYLNEIGMINRWLDARNFVVTSSHHRRARINWDTTENLIGKKAKKLIEKQLTITQGFIGRTTENTNSTLGREGSDYTAAIFAYSLDAQSVTIWKDVPGVMNADPKRISETTLLSDISFKEAIELAYYGASVIHPKTIQPLMKKKIPLYVKSFLSPENSGTVVMEHDGKNVVHAPCYIFKDNQILISLSSKDLAFIVEDNLSQIFSSLAAAGIQINLMQNTATSFSLCTTNDSYRIGKFLEFVKDNYLIEQVENLQLLTVFNPAKSIDLEAIAPGKQKILEHVNENALQLILR